MITRARRENRLWGAGLRPPPSRLTERHVVTKETFNHLRDWIFSTDLLEPLKASEQSTQRGHCFAVKEAATTTYPRYQQSADDKGVDAVTERVYRRVLSQRVFTKYRKDHCMCTTCLRSGWRGIFDNGNKVINAMDRLDTSFGIGLSARLKRLWNFIRLQLHLHFEDQSGIAAHCTRLHLGSLAEPRFDEPCIPQASEPQGTSTTPRSALGSDTTTGKVFASRNYPFATGATVGTQRTDSNVVNVHPVQAAVVTKVGRECLVRSNATAEVWNA